MVFKFSIFSKIISCMIFSTSRSSFSENCEKIGQYILCFFSCDRYGIYSLLSEKFIIRFFICSLSSDFIYKKI